MNAPARIDDVLAAASNGHSHTATTRRLLAALATHEGDSHLGNFAHAALHSGPFYKMSFREDFEAAEDLANTIVDHAADLAQEYIAEAQEGQA